VRERERIGAAAMSGNNLHKIIDPKADEAVQRAMASMQQQIQLAIMVVELRDRFALSILHCAAPMSGRWPDEDAMRAAYRCADLMLHIRQEKPSEAPVPAQP
jgi:hypothetical protein